MIRKQDLFFLFMNSKREPLGLGKRKDKGLRSRKPSRIVNFSSGQAERNHGGVSFRSSCRECLGGADYAGWFSASQPYPFLLPKDPEAPSAVP